MKRSILALALSVALIGCIGVHRGGQSLVGIVLSREERKPIPDVAVSIEYSLNLFTGSQKKIGPYYTDASGRFTVPAHEFTIVTTATVFDGSTKATFFLASPDGIKWVNWEPERNANGELVFLAPPKKKPIESSLPTPSEKRRG